MVISVIILVVNYQNTKVSKKKLNISFEKKG